MTWLLWRQHRRQSLVAGIGLGVFALVLWLSSSSKTARLSSDTALNNVVSLTIAVPLLIGLFWGVTAVGRELDTGTHLLAWTQSVTKREWLRGKIIVTLTAAALWGAVIAALVTWWSGPINGAHRNRFDPGRFDVQGLVPVAYAIFAAALGLAAGALLRRLLPALAATLAVFITLRLVIISYVRPHFASPLTITTPLVSGPDLPSGSWILSEQIQLHGHIVNGGIQIPRDAGCQGTRDAVDACIHQLGYTGVTKYQPASRYWSFQYIESGIFVALAAILIVVTVIAVQRRDA
jgi:hypothetical protein